MQMDELEADLGIVYYDDAGSTPLSDNPWPEIHQWLDRPEDPREVGNTEINFVW